MEDFVTFELAKKLKEKGYPQHITDDAYIVDNYGEEECDIGDRLPIPLVPDYMDDVAAPTISQVLKWLREEKKMHIKIAVWTEGWYNEVCEFGKGIPVFQGQSEDHDTYEEAALAGIEYVIDNLI